MRRLLCLLWFAGSGNGRVGRLTTPKCDGQVATVLLGGYGAVTAGNDVIVGTPARDVINAAAGNDRVCGRGGNDTLRGQAGLDRVFGDGGNDTLNGGSEADVCVGGTGTDAATKCETTTGVP